RRPRSGWPPGDTADDRRRSHGGVVTLIRDVACRRAAERGELQFRRHPRPPGPEPAIAGVVLAGGSGLRVGKDRNKAYLPLGSRTAVGISLQTMAAATTPGLRRLVLVVRADDLDLAERTLDEEFPRPPVPVELVVGGASR